MLASVTSVSKVGLTSKLSHDSWKKAEDKRPMGGLGIYVHSPKTSTNGKNFKPYFQWSRKKLAL